MTQPASFRGVMGLETEYAIRYRSPDQRRTRPTDHVLFNRLVASLSKAVPVADSSFLSHGYFLANGGAISFETSDLSAEHGLVEGATPECRSPRELLVWQRAQDRLLSLAARNSRERGGEFVLIKNNRDGKGNAYGSHENYETVFAGGLRLAVWRALLIVLIPISAACMGVLIVITLAAFGLTSVTTRLAHWIRTRLRALRTPARNNSPRHAGGSGSSGSGSGGSGSGEIPRWMQKFYRPLIGFACAPVYVALGMALWALAFARIRKRVVPFLISRVVWSGAGWVDSEGTFFISQKADVCNRVCGLGGIGMPILNYGNFLKRVLMAPISWHAIRSLGESRQRLQLSFGDSSLCEEAEYLKIATTRLVLDMIESGECKIRIRIGRPIAALRKLNADGISAVIAASGGKSLNAVDVQRMYLAEVRKYVARNQLSSNEVNDILRRWERVLDQLETEPDSLLGRVDWITKRIVLDRVGADVPVVSQRKIDIKYHETSAAGYYNRLCESEFNKPMVEADELERAMRNPPPNSLAQQRCRYIREFAGTNVPIGIYWDAINIGTGRRRRLVRMTAPVD